MKFVTAKMRFAAVAVVMSMGSYTSGVQAEPIGNAAAGQEKAGLCGGCHGADGNSEDATYPRLAGQYAGYIVKQVTDFQKGHRANNETMTGMAAMVASVEDAKDIGTYFSQQKMKGALTKPAKDSAAAGESLFREGNVKTGVYACINCHGESGKGKSATISVFPVIGGQHRDYLVKQLKDFRGGVRANDPGGMMSGIAKNLTDKEIESVAEYLSGQL